MNDLLRCCGSRMWAEAMAAAAPFADEDEMRSAGDRIWRGLDGEDWLEAFRAHPKIGRRTSLSAWSKQEQAGTTSADEEQLRELDSLNRAYEERFGYIFIICATGRSTEQIMSAMRRRLSNSPAMELSIAADEHLQITRLRLAKLAAES